ncbi:MAG: VanW family protein [Johnsonella sp.]|nr:VanW family protein [Johnsonella sp.]
MAKIRVKKYTVFLAALSIGLFAHADEARAVSLPAGLSVGEIDLQGLSAEEAGEKLDSYVGAVSDKPIIIEVNGSKASTSAKELGFEWEQESLAKEAIAEYTSGNIVERYIKQVELEKSPVHIELEVGTDQEKFDAFMEENFVIDSATAVDATIRRENGAFQITDEVDGIKLNKESTKRMLDEALRNADQVEQIEIAADTEIDRAKIRREDLEGITDILGTYTTDFSSSSGARANNIKVGSAKLNGKLLMPGEILSGYENMHPFTVANGYQIAHAFENGQVVDSVGGGACQIATTLYNASLRAEVGITERKNHSMTVGYCPASADAAIAGTYKDIKITNNYESPIFVESYTSGGKLTFTIWGKDSRAKDRTVEYVSEILSSTPAGITYKDDPSLPAGTQVKESSGHNGRKSRLWKVIKIGGVEVERVLVSTDTYITSNAIYRRGTGVPAVLPSETSETEASSQEGGGSSDPSDQPSQGSLSPSRPIGPGETVPAPAPAPAPETSVPIGPGVEMP